MKVRLQNLHDQGRSPEIKSQDAIYCHILSERVLLEYCFTCVDIHVVLELVFIREPLVARLAGEWKFGNV